MTVFKRIKNIISPDKQIVYTKDGGKKFIRDVEVGDILLGEHNIYNTVEKVDKQRTPKRTYLKINGGDYYFYELQTIWVNGKYVHGFDIKVGDMLQSITGGNIEVKTIEKIRTRLPFYRFSLSGDHSYFINGVLVHNASRYWVGGTGDWDAADTTHWAASSGGAGGQSVPSTTDDVFFDLHSNEATDTAYTVTITGASSAINCQNINVAFTGTTKVTIAGTSTLNIYGSINMSGGTAQITWSHTGVIHMHATSGTKTITSNGIVFLGYFFIIGTGTFQLADNFTHAGSNKSFVLNNGTFDINGKAFSVNFLDLGNVTTATFADIATGGSITITGNGSYVLLVVSTGLTLTTIPKITLNYAGATGIRVISNSTPEGFLPDIEITGGTDTLSVGGSKFDNLDLTGFAGTFGDGSLVYIYGNFTCSIGVTFADNLDFTATTGIKTITSGSTLKSITFNGIGGTWKLGSNITLGVTGTLTITNGEVTAINGASNYVISAGKISVGAGGTLTLGSATHLLTGTAIVFTGTGTITASTGTIKITNTANTAITFAGGGKTYNNVWFSRGASTGINLITGSNTFADLKSDPGTILTLEGGSKQIISSLTSIGTNAAQIILKRTEVARPYVASSTIVIPANVTQVIVRCWGGGGASGGSTSDNGGGGGGSGGQYSEKLVSVIAGNTYNIIVGAVKTNATTGDGGNGNDTIFDDGATQLVIAKGGAGGLAYQNGGVGGVGSAVGGVGDTVYRGGNGANGSTTYSGGGGGAAGTTGNGGDTANATAGVGTSLSGGNGGAGKTTGANGANGVATGGGASGGFRTTVTSRNGASGAVGRMEILFIETFISDTTGVNDLEYTTISNLIAEGGATFNALLSDGNVNGGGNSGWIFSLPPTVTTQAVTDKGLTTGTGNGNITDIGGINATRYGVCWIQAASGDPTTSDSVAYTDGDFGVGAFTQAMTGLTAGLPYRVRAFATNPTGTGYGATVDYITIYEKILSEVVKIVNPIVTKLISITKTQFIKVVSTLENVSSLVKLFVERIVVISGLANVTTFIKELIETIVVSDIYERISTWFKTLIEEIKIVSVFENIKSLLATFVEQIKIVALYENIKSFLVEFVESINIIPVLENQVVKIKELVESILVSDTYERLSVWVKTFVEIVFVTPVQELVSSIFKTFTEILNVGDTLTLLKTKILNVSTETIKVVSDFAGARLLDLSEIIVVVSSFVGGVISKVIEEIIKVSDGITRTITRIFTEIVIVVGTILKLTPKIFLENIKVVGWIAKKIMGKMLIEVVKVYIGFTRVISRLFKEVVKVRGFIAQLGSSLILIQVIKITGTMLRFNIGKLFKETVIIGWAKIKLVLNGIQVGLWKKIARVTNGIWHKISRNDN